MLKAAYIAAILLTATVILFTGLIFGYSGEEISIAVSPRSVFLGDVVTIKLALRYPEGSKVVVPDPEKILTGLAVIKQEKRDSSFLWRIRREILWSVTADNIGEYIIPSLNIAFIGPSGVTRELKTPPQSVTWNTVQGVNESYTYTARVSTEMAGIGSSLADGGGAVSSRDGPIRIKIKDEKSPVDIIDYRGLFISVIAGVVGLIVVSIGYFIWSVLSQRKPPASPDKKLLNSLAVLELKIKSGSAPVKDCYYDLSSCLRAYLKAILHLDAHEPVTKELIAAVHNSSVITDESKALFEDLLTVCDTIKYSAKLTADMSKLIGYLEKVRSVPSQRPGYAETGRR